MPYMRDSFWRGRESLSREQALVWYQEVAGRRQYRPPGVPVVLGKFWSDISDQL